MTMLEDYVCDAPRGFDVLAYWRPLKQWRHVADEELPIPRDYVAARAYFRYLERGELDGFDAEDWRTAEHELRYIFREYVEYLKVLQERKPAEGSSESVVLRPRTPKTNSAKPLNGEAQQDADNDGLSRDTFKEESKAMTTVVVGDVRVGVDVDRRGNVWLEPPLVRSEISPDVFQSVFADARAICVHLTTDLVYVAGNDLGALEASLSERGLNAADFAIEPGAAR